MFSLPIVTLLTAVLFAPGDASVHHSASADRRVAATPDAAQFEATFQALYDLEPDKQRVARVSDLSLPLAGGDFTMQSGTLAELSIGGKVIGVAFDGSGRFRLSPPTQVERDQLQRFFETPEIDMEVGRFVLLHSAAAEVQAILDRLTFAPDPQLDGGSSDIVEQALEYLGDKDSRTADSQVMSMLLNGMEEPFIYLHMDPDDDDPIFYRFNEAMVEEVSFGWRARVKGRRFELISQFDTPAEEPVPGGERAFQEVDIVNYELATVLDDDLDFSAVANVLVVPNRGGSRWIPFVLGSLLEVESVEWNGEPVEFFRGKESAQLWILAPESTVEGAPVQLRVRYAGDMIDKTSVGWYAIRGATSWYPRHGEIDATFSMTFEVPDDFQFTAAGHEVERRPEGEVIHWKYVIDRPAPHATFNIGKFEEYPLEQEGSPSIVLQVNEMAHRRMERFLLQDDIGEMVGRDVTNALAFFGERFGELPYEEFSVTEIPYFHGQAFPGMIELSWVTFQWTGKDGGDEIFRAHEVAHQWWGLGVEPATYHDTWLSEGLAEFSGLWYMQRVLMDNEKYFDHLEDSREALVDRRGKSGPIWLGPRVYTSRTEEDYQTVVYEKGAWVMHMLRNMMIDVDTMNEDAFFGMLRDLYQTYSNRSVTTEQFQEIVEARIATDMQWFFDQWVYGTGIPKYTFSHQGKQTAEGWKETVRVVQSEVPDDFMMIVPILIDFGDEGSAIVRTLITGPVSEFELPLLPREPDNIEFNTLSSVLAEVDEVDWRN